MKSSSHEISLPKELVVQIDNLLAKTSIDTNRSSLIKFCATYQPPDLTITQEAAAIAMLDLMEEKSKYQMQRLSLRSRRMFKQDENTVLNICRCLVYLGFYRMICQDDAIF